MSKKTILLLILAIGLVGGVISALFHIQQKNPLSTPLTDQKIAATRISPSTTLKTYTDPVGFTFSYPDNLSLVNNDLKDESIYADLQLISKGIDGSLSLQIADSKFTTLDQWSKTVKNGSQTPTEVNLGNLKGQQISTGDKLLLAALDQGVLFSIEIPLGSNKDFWMEVYNKFIKDFSFAPPSSDTVSQGGSADITLEGEDVVE